MLAGYVGLFFMYCVCWHTGYDRWLLLLSGFEFYLTMYTLAMLPDSGNTE
jgi:hypothetical protein